MNDNDIVDVVLCPQSVNSGQLSFRLRNGELVTIEGYIAQKVAEQIEQYLRDTQ